MLRSKGWGSIYPKWLSSESHGSERLVVKWVGLRPTHFYVTFQIHMLIQGSHPSRRVYPKSFQVRGVASPGWGAASSGPRVRTSRVQGRSLSRPIRGHGRREFRAGCCLPRSAGVDGASPGWVAAFPGSQARRCESRRVAAIPVRECGGASPGWVAAWVYYPNKPI
jgi:hypothetical protein